MNRKPYSAGAVKFSFWFIEFRKTVQLLAEGKSFFGNKTAERAREYLQRIHKGTGTDDLLYRYGAHKECWTPAFTRFS